MRQKIYALLMLLVVSPTWATCPAGKVQGYIINSAGKSNAPIDNGKLGTALACANGLIGTTYTNEGGARNAIAACLPGNTVVGSNGASPVAMSTVYGATATYRWEDWACATNTGTCASGYGAFWGVYGDYCTSADVPPQPDPPPPNTCVANTPNGFVASDQAGAFTCPPGAAGSTRCQIVTTGIGLNVGGSQKAIHTYTTGAQCTDSSTPSPPAVPSVTINGKPGVCLTDSKGNQHCATAQSSVAAAPQEDKSCGYVNGEKICTNVASTSNPCITAGGVSVCISAASQCLTSASGARICAAGAANTARPDNGTAGTVATADGHLRATQDTGATVTLDYYGPSTVGSSSNTGGAGTGSATGTSTGGTTGTSTGGTTGGGSGGDCSSDPTKCGGEDKSLSGGEDCSVPPTCSGEPIECYIAQQEWTNACLFKKPDASDAKSEFDSGATAGGGTVTLGSMLPVHETKDAGGIFSTVSLGSGTCPQDYTVHLAQLNTTFTVPFSQACSLLRLVRAFVLIGALYAAFKVYTAGWF